MTTTDLTIVVATHNEGKLAEMRQILEECLGSAPPACDWCPPVR